MRSIFPRLPRRVWALEAAALVTYFGSGLILPWELIYLHDVRGFPLELAGGIAGAWPAAALLGGVVGGWASDHFGPRASTIAHLLLGAGGLAGFAFVTRPWEAFACSAAIGLAVGGGNPSQSMLLSAVASADERNAAFAVEFAVANLGIAAGAATGGFVANVARPHTFTTLFVLDAICTVVFAGLVAVVARGVARPERPTDGSPRGSYRAALRQRAVLGFAGVTAIFAIGGVAIFEFALPIFARNEQGLSEHTIGILFLLNSATIVLVQLPLAKLLEGRRRLQAIACAMGFWVVAWALAGAAALGPNGVETPLFAIVAVLFALGECMIAPIQGSLIADLSSDELRGRSLALQSNAYAVGLMLGPVVIGLLLARAPLALWPVAAGVVAAAGIAALALERAVPVAVRRVPRAEPEQAEAPAVAAA